MNAPQHKCPENDVLQELAAGILAPAMAEKTMLHAAECKSCARTLKQYLNEFSDEQSPENIAILKQLQSSKPEWQRKLVRELKGGGRRFPWLKLVPATAALAAVIFAFVEGPALWAGLQVKQAQKEVATAFVQRRTTLSRLPQVGYASYNPFPRVLGAEDGRSVDEVPPSLHEASGAANKNLQAGNADPRWLQIQGRALLWESTPSSLEKAEKDFEKARSEGLTSASLEIDLAASYFERDSRAGHPNLQRTLNLLSEVLTKPKLSKDDQASALFNLAIAYEKTEAWDLAVETWQKYLQVDSTGEWANEARQRLENAIAKASVQHQQSYSDPSFFLQQKAQGTLRPEDPEQYQQKALSEWLPAAVADKNSEAYRALQSLAEVFAEHQDFWWRDFLKGTQPKDLDAVQELASVTLSNEQGAHNDALAHSRAAIKSFRSAGNLPGELLARFQEVYALRSMMDGDDCVARADPLVAQSAKARFTWLYGQSLLERAQCRNFQAQLAKSDADAAQSLNVSKQHFPVLTMRVLGIVPGMKRQQGKYEESWTRAVEGLKAYWQGAYPAERLDQFYAVMLQDAEDAHYPYLAESLLRHNIAIRTSSNNGMKKNALREGMLRLDLANLLNRRQAGDEAKQEMQTASAIFQSVAHSYPDNYRTLNNFKTAENELQRQEAERALAALKAMSESVERTQNKELALNYYRLLGGVHLRLQQLDEAGASFESAIEIADAALEGLPKDADRESWRQATEESYRGAVRVLLAQKKDREALERWEQYKGRISQQRPLATEIPAATTVSAGRKSILQFASSPTLRLIYANFSDGVQIWSVKNGEVHSSWVKMAKNDLENELRLFAEQCATPDSSLIDVERQGLKLYALLLQPVAAELAESKSVIVELDQSAYDLSLESLKTPAGHYFGEKYSVVYSPGMWTEQLLRSPGAIGQTQSLFLLDATRSVYLPGMDVERAFIAKTFPRSRVVDAENANWENSRHDVAASQIFVFMGHGLRSNTGTNLVLSPKVSLGAADFTPDRFAHSEMVVLAACSSGRSGKEGLQDNNNLVHSFLVAGVPRIVASHWDVDSGSTSQLMVSFYRHVLTDSTVAEAMLDARRDVLEKTPHPYYWAGFSITGRVN